MTFELCHLVTWCMKLLCSARKGLALAWERAPSSVATAQPHLPEGGEKLLVWDLASQKGCCSNSAGYLSSFNSAGMLAAQGLIHAVFGRNSQDAAGLLLTPLWAL